MTSIRLIARNGEAARQALERGEGAAPGHGE